MSCRQLHLPKAIFLIMSVTILFNKTQNELKRIPKICVNRCKNNWKFLIHKAAVIVVATGGYLVTRNKCYDNSIVGVICHFDC